MRFNVIKSIKYANRCIIVCYCCCFFYKIKLLDLRGNHNLDSRGAALLSHCCDRIEEVLLDKILQGKS